MAENKYVLLCELCKNHIKSKSLQCDGECKLFYHKKCLKLSSLEYKEIIDNRLNKYWFCKNCTEKRNHRFELTDDIYNNSDSETDLEDDDYDEDDTKLNKNSAIHKKLDRILCEIKSNRNEIKTNRNEIKSNKNEIKLLKSILESYKTFTNPEMTTNNVLCKNNDKTQNKFSMFNDLLQSSDSDIEMAQVTRKTPYEVSKGRHVRKKSKLMNQSDNIDSNLKSLSRLNNTKASKDLQTFQSELLMYTQDNIKSEPDLDLIENEPPFLINSINIANEIVLDPNQPKSSENMGNIPESDSTPSLTLYEYLHTIYNQNLITKQPSYQNPKYIEIFDDRSISPANLFTSTKTLRQLLGESAIGRSILGLKTLTSSSRSQLVNIIVNHLINNNINNKINSDQFTSWAESIISTYTNEEIETYYTPYVGGINRQLPKGKLYDRYVRIRRLLKQGNKTNIEQEPEQLLEIKDINDDFENIIDEKEQILIWEENYVKRVKLNIFTVSEYFEKFQMVKAEDGYKWLLMDFEIKYPQSKDNLHKNWHSFARNIIKLAKYKNKLSFIKSYNTPQESDDLASLAFLVLPYLFNCVSKIASTSWKPSCEETSDGFVMQLLNLNELTVKISKKKEKLKKLNLLLQPFVAFVASNISNPIAIYVIINNIKWKVSSILEGVDVCFKSMQMLHCNYSAESEHVWLFLQQKLYNIKTVYDKKSTMVSLLTSELNSI